MTLIDLPLKIGKYSRISVLLREFFRVAISSMPKNMGQLPYNIFHPRAEGWLLARIFVFVVQVCDPLAQKIHIELLRELHSNSNILNQRYLFSRVLIFARIHFRDLDDIRKIRANKFSRNFRNLHFREIREIFYRDIFAK